MSGRTESAPLNRGGQSSSDLSNMLGTEYSFPDYYLPPSGSNARTLRSTRWNTVRLVKNSSGIALLPKRMVRFKAGTNGTEVDGYTATTAQRGAGIVDEWLPSAGVPDGSYFYILREGVSEGLTDLAGGAANVIGQDTVLVALTAATSGATTAGRVAVQSLAGATEVLGLPVQNAVGIAQSAMTTANTNSGVLAAWSFSRFAA